MPKQLRFHPVAWGIIASTLILFAASSYRHIRFQSSAFDLAIYDQVVYLISRGLPPISSFLGFHHLGNHVAFSVYPLALLYAIYPSVYWLLAVQAIGLSLGALPTWLLARQAGLAPSLSIAVVISYLLYPLLFNVNLFDFHPEVMAVPVILAAIWTARVEKRLWFCAAIVFILGCKDGLSPMVAAMGLWLLVFEKRRFYGWFALIAGVSWFFIATQLIIPYFSGEEAAAVSRYAYLGDSVLEIAQNLFLKPELVLGQIFRLSTLSYLLAIVAPLLWGLAPRYLAPLVATIPTLAFNILSTNTGMKTLARQYSLPILPFLMVAVIATLASNRGLLRSRRWIILWSIVTFIGLGNYAGLRFYYVNSADVWQASREAVAKIQPQSKILTDDRLASHLSHRQTIHLACGRTSDRRLNLYDSVLISSKNIQEHRQKCVPKVVERAKTNPNLQLSYDRDGVYLFTRADADSSSTVYRPQASAADDQSGHNG